MLGPVGRLGLLAFLADGPLPPPLPEGNDFCTAAELDDLVRTAGFQVVQTTPAGSPADAPVSWRARADRVENALVRRHVGDPRWETAQEQTARMARLISGGHLRPTLLHAVAV